MKKDIYPFNCNNDALNWLHGATYFSFIDLHSGYWQIAVDDMGCEKTAFVMRDGLHQFKVMPYNLRNILATFNCGMDSYLWGN